MITTALCAHHVCLYITTTRRWLCQIHNENPTAQRTNDNRVCLSIHECVSVCLCASESEIESTQFDVMLLSVLAAAVVVLLLPFYLVFFSDLFIFRVAYYILLSSHTNTVCN